MLVSSSVGSSESPVGEADSVGSSLGLADSEEPTEEETSTQAAEPAGSNFGTVFGIAAIVLVLLLLAALPAIWRSILRSRRTKDPQNLEAVWTEVRALATDYGQSLDSSRTLRFNELVLAGAVPAAGAAGAAGGGGGGGTEAADASSPTDAEAGSTAPKIDADTGEPIRKSAAEAAAGSGAAGENAAGSSTFDRSDERLRRLSSPAPSRPSESGHDDSALGAFVDALEAQRTYLRLRLTVDPVKERRGMLWDNYRIMAQQYWRADMDGMDWHAMTSWYDPVIERLVTEDDFQDMMWEVQGELGTSHAYVQGGVYKADPPMLPAHLGADLDRRDGRWVITRILPGDSSDPDARSPLLAPGVDARVGDAVLRVDGRDVGAEGIEAALVGSAGTPTELVLERDGAEHRVAITPLGGWENCPPKAWVHVGHEETSMWLARSEGRKALYTVRVVGEMPKRMVEDKGDGWDRYTCAYVNRWETVGRVSLYLPKSRLELVDKVEL